MALIKCEGCGQMISNKAVKCPYCGKPMLSKPLSKQNSVSEGKVVGLVVLLGCLLPIVGTVIYVIVCLGLGYAIYEIVNSVIF